MPIQDYPFRALSARQILTVTKNLISLAQNIKQSGCAEEPFFVPKQMSGFVWQRRVGGKATVD